jgi:hypothetical protein
MMPGTTQAAFATALVDAGAPIPGGITTARGVADPARFAVYRNNVFVSLTAALAKRFPVVRRLVGEEFFAGMARVYAGLEKPSSPLMFRYGDAFPDFISGFEPARGLPYLADVARIEAAWTVAYHAADVSPLGAGDLAAIPPERLAEARLASHPAATTIQSRFPVGSIWTAHQRDPVEPVRSSNAETVVVVRPGLDVRVHILPDGDADFAQALMSGKTLGVAAQRAVTRQPDFDFGAALVGLVSLGAFAGIAREEKKT